MSTHLTADQDNPTTDPNAMVPLHLFSPVLGYLARHIYHHGKEDSFVEATYVYDRVAQALGWQTIAERLGVWEARLDGLSNRYTPVELRLPRADD